MPSGCGRLLPGGGIALTPTGAGRIRIVGRCKAADSGFRQFGAIAAEMFGLIERLVRGGDEIPMFCAYVGYQTRDADAQMRVTMLNVVRAGVERQSLANPLCEHCRIFKICVRQQHGEFVAAIARAEIRRALHIRGDRCGNGAAARRPPDGRDSRCRA